MAKDLQGSDLWDSLFMEAFLNEFIKRRALLARNPINLIIFDFLRFYLDSLRSSRRLYWSLHRSEVDRHRRCLVGCSTYIDNQLGSK